MTPPSPILITGGNGNLGRLVAAEFEALGAQVIAYDLPGTEGPHSDPRHAVVLGDIRDTDLLEDTIKTNKPKAVVHLASLLSGSSEANPDLAWEVNATASFRLMQLARAHGTGPFVFASTVVSYGPGVPSHLPEDAPQWPQTIYGATKVAVERAGGWQRARGLDFRCIRFPMVLSPFAPPGAVTAYPSLAFWAAAKGEAFTFPVRTETGMSTLFLRDVTRSLVEFTCADAARLTKPAYNIHAFHFSAGDLAARIQAAFPGFAYDFAPDEAVDEMINCLPDTMDADAAERDWDWRVGYDYDACVKAMVEIVKGPNP
ncbi:MAG: NAD-dependent epimerase/dehydratase family protein [Pseudomonadota bacterium]